MVVYCYRKLRARKTIHQYLRVILQLIHVKHAIAAKLAAEHLPESRIAAFSRGSE